MKQKSIPQRIQDTLSRHPDWSDGRVAESVGVRVAEVRAAREGSPPATSGATPSCVVGGIALENRAIFTQRPQDRAKGLIYSVARGRGFPVKELSAQWGMSEETIIAHAKRFDCFRYVEVEPGRYVPCVLHPDTAQQHGG